MSTSTTSRQSLSKLSLAELLIVLALVGVALAIARRWWDAWETEEWTLATGWLAAWVVGVIGGRALIGRAVLPAATLCVATATGIAFYYNELPWPAKLIIVGAALLLTLVTAPLPRAIMGVLFATWDFCHNGRPHVRWTVVTAAGLAAAGAIAPFAARCFEAWRSPAVATELIRRFQVADSHVSNRRADKHVLACISINGDLLVLDGSRGVEIYNTRTGLLQEVPNSSKAEAAAISPDGRRVACFVRGDDFRLESVCVLDVKTGERLFRGRLSQPPFVIRFDSEGMFVAAQTDRKARQLRVETWRLDPSPAIVETWRFEYPNGGELSYMTDELDYGLVDYAEDDTITRWQLWELKTPGKLLMDSINGNFPWKLRVGDGEWFAGMFTLWNRTRTAEIEIDGTISGMDRSREHLVVVRYNGVSGPPFPRTGLSDEFMVQIPFWRLLNDPVDEVQLWLYDLTDPRRIWKSSPVPFEPYLHHGSLHHRTTPEYEIVITPDCSTVAVQDDTGKIIVWRTARSPFSRN